MKKKLMALALCLSLGMTMFGCGKDNKKEEETEKTAGNTVYTKEDLVDDTAAEVNVLDYVELAEFVGIDLTKEVTEVTEEDVQTSMQTNTVEMVSEEVVVADGDTTVIDFEGKLDGVAFDGGTSENYTLVIGSNSFIDGFEDGLIGVRKGETVDLDLTFPENYTNEDLSGKAVVFTVTVKEVKRVPEELTDEWLAANTKYASAAEYQSEVKAKLEQDAEDTAQYNLESAALDYVITNSTIKKYFKSFVDEGETQYENYINTYASYYGMDLSAFISAQGMTNDQYNEAKAQQGISYAKAAMIVQAVAKTEGFTTEDEKYQAILADVASQYGMDAAMLTTAYGESLVNNSVMSEYVMEYIASNANVTTKVVSSGSESETTG